MKLKPEDMDKIGDTLNKIAEQLGINPDQIDAQMLHPDEMSEMEKLSKLLSFVQAMWRSPKDAFIPLTVATSYIVGQDAELKARVLRKEDDPTLWAERQAYVSQLLNQKADSIEKEALDLRKAASGPFNLEARTDSGKLDPKEEEDLRRALNNMPSESELVRRAS